MEQRRSLTGDDLAGNNLIDRPRGFLTPEDRQFLRWIGDGQVEKELSPEAARQRRYRLRQRTKNAILDFIDLHLLSQNDKTQIFTGAAETPAELSAENHTLNGGLLNLFRFLADNLTNDVFRLLVTEAFELKIRNDLMTKKNTYADVTVDIDVTVSGETSIDELKSRYDAGEELSTSEISTLCQANRIGYDEWVNGRPSEGERDTSA